MSRVAVVTDSTADLAPALAAPAGLRVVPLFVRFGGEEFRVGVDLSTEQFWDRMLAPDAPFPSTAAPSPGTFQETFEDLFAGGADGDRLPDHRLEAVRHVPAARRWRPRRCPVGRSTSSTP